MRTSLVSQLRCPVSGRSLELHVLEEDSDHVLEGFLHELESNRIYPVTGGVPRMLTFRIPLTEDFVRDHRPRIEELAPGATLPGEEAPPGEREVLRTFSKEWTEYDWDDQSYWGLSVPEMQRVMGTMLRTDERPLRGKRVLEVGIGIGGIAKHLAETQGAEVIGVDLGFATDSAFHNFGSQERFNIVQASAFALPFEEGVFDLVYSQGVLHHTYDTERAVRSVAKFAKPDTGVFYVWVYSDEDESRNLLRRLLMGAERMLRPTVTALKEPWQSLALAPMVPAYIAYQNFVRAPRHPEATRYGVREAMHAARDRFTPRYVHRHSYEEVEGWLRSAGFGELRRVSELAAADVPIAFTACTGVEGVRGQVS